MRILVISKRQYTGKDLIDDRYGRLFELPERLQAAGHEVRAIALSYRRKGERTLVSPQGVTWHSFDALPFGAMRYQAMVDALVEEWRPDVVWASSDAFHAVLARRIHRRHGIPYVVDLYDNYESFGLTRWPGLRRGLRDACREAAAVTVVTSTLREKVRAEYAPQGEVIVLGNGVDPGVFHPHDRVAARRALGLPEQAKIIGTAGALTRHRGIDDLFRAFERLAERHDTLWLAYAGPRDGSPRRHPHPRAIDLGVLPQHAVPRFISALDVAVVCNRDSAFGRYCYPMKLEEAIACGTPVVAANVGDVGARLSFDDGSLFPPGDDQALAAKLSERLAATQPGATLAPVTWDALADTLENVLKRATREGGD
ncbi:glycosyltransferase [Lysobacter sp. LF1]|uniref:Glycosyltransferase n=1 Tax=Lysobacter stagni TaxID=3045172 RepID=A0ABT6XFX4_9GAMM|nr:glycosyltransferase [Lysobacter sp. LF1]MDI9238833.1 glycosyltransferase [Lysobacter sp. LF1]